MTRTRFTWAVFLLASFTFAAVARGQSMSLIPKAEFGGYPYSFLDACNNMSQWPNVLSVTSDLGSFVADLNAGDDSSLSTCFSNMQEAGLELTIEAAAVQPGGCGGGVGCYNSLASTLTRMINLGAPAIRIRLQEPLTDGREAGWNDGDIVNETVTFLAWLRSNYSVQVTSVEAYPYNSASSLNWWMSALKISCDGAGVQPPDNFELDHDLNASGWSWSDVWSMQGQAHSLGWGFGYIFGSPVPSWQQSWAANAFAQGPYVTGAPDVYTFESWESSDPSTTIPETYSGSGPWSFMFTANDFRNVGYFPR